MEMRSDSEQENAARSEDKLIPLKEVPNLDFLPARRSGKKLHVDTIWGWVRDGKFGIRLKTYRVGSSTCTTPSDLKAFFAAVALVKFGQQ